jgi:folylpolyglutamate synthase/dihydropteroate synthase
VLADLALVRPPHAVVQVIGTNGKGSTAAMLSAIGLEHGLTVGLYTIRYCADFVKYDALAQHKD